MSYQKTEDYYPASKPDFRDPQGVYFKPEFPGSPDSSYCQDRSFHGVPDFMDVVVAIGIFTMSSPVINQVRELSQERSSQNVAIRVDRLTRRFGDLTAVDNISFEIDKGEIFGLLGPNGAGKTTTLSMLSTMLKPSSGSAVVDGKDILNDEDGVRKSIGIVFQDQSLDEELTAWENMDFHGRLYRIPGEIRRQRITELLVLVGLDDRKDDIVKTFSGGMRRRLEIARGLLHHPVILFLDEPTLGLDPQTRNHLWQYIEKLSSEKGITIILTTHYMEEADRLCNRVAIIDHGRIIALDTPENLKAGLGGDIVTIRTPTPEAVPAALNEPWVTRLEQNGVAVSITLQNADEHISAIVTDLSRNKILIESVSIHKPTLEDVFLHYTGKTIRAEEASGKENMRMYQKMMNRR